MAEPRSDSADVLIIGAGVYGCALAYFLSSFGRDVLVVDADDIGAGASGANAGNLHLQLSPFSHADKSREWVEAFVRNLPLFLDALELWRQLAGELPGNLELRCPGGLMVAQTAEQLARLRDKVALEQSQGLDVHLIDGAELRALAPYLSESVIAASYCPQEGMANALGAVVALADGARRNGARFLLHAPVKRVQESGGTFAVDTLRGTLHGRNLVVAAGSSSADVAALAGLDIPLAQRVIQIVATEPCERFIDHLVYHGEARLTLKQAANGNVIIGGGWTAAVDRVFARPAVLHESLRGSLAVAHAVVPSLACVNVIRSWAGPNVYTPDGNPILGAVPGRPGLWLAVCNTYGFTLGPLCALLVAQAITGRATAYDLDRYSIARFAGAALRA